MATDREIDPDTGFTAALDISTYEKTKFSVARLVRTVRDRSVSALGKPTAGVDKMAVSYRWKYPTTTHELLSPSQVDSLIAALNAEREENGRLAVSLWFDRKMCAEQVPSDWISIGLNAYINHDVIRLVEDGETLEHVQECERGWLRLELEAGKTGGYVRVNGDVLSEGHEFEGLPEDKAYFRRSTVSCCLVQLILSREFKHFKFSKEKDLERLQKWCQNSTPVIGA